MSDFALAHAADASARELSGKLAAGLAAAAGADGHSLGFLYATSALATDYAGMVRDLRQRTGIARWVGTVGHGICATGAEYFDRPAAVALTCSLAEDAVRIMPSQAEPEAIARSIDAGLPAAIGIVHADPRNPSAGALVGELARHAGVYLVGGLTSAEQAFPQAAGGAVVEGGISGVLLGGRGLSVAVGLTQGCSPIGATHTIGETDGQVVVTLDGRPAYEVLREDVGAAPDADPRRWLVDIHAARPIPGSDRADYLVRNIVGIGPEQGLIAIADTLSPGDRLMFVRRDPDSASLDLERMLADLKGRVTGRPKAGLYFSCLARGPNLFADEAHEVRAIARAVGDIPLAGFFGNGEIAHDRLYGYTGVLTLFL